MWFSCASSPKGTYSTIYCFVNFTNFKKKKSQWNINCFRMNLEQLNKCVLQAYGSVGVSSFRLCHL